jgi:flagellar motility protein MotE (MotC chaperone)
MARSGLSRRTLTRPLMVVAIMLVGSAAIRVSEGVGPVMATTKAAFATAADTPKSCPTEPELDLLHKSLVAREAELLDQAKVVVAREAAVRAAEEDLARMRAEFDAAQQELERAEADFKKRYRTAETASEADILQLVAVYQAMKPKEAAKVFEAMSPEFASGFLREMPTDTAASILASLAPEFAYSVSVLMAGRNVSQTVSN